MAVITHLFALEGNPVEITAFSGKIPYECNLCFQEVHKGHSLSHSEGNEIVFCNTCFNELKLAIGFIILQEEDRN